MERVDALRGINILLETHGADDVAWMIHTNMIRRNPNGGMTALPSCVASHRSSYRLPRRTFEDESKGPGGALAQCGVDSSSLLES
jgi:hypothetical protein